METVTVRLRAVSGTPLDDATTREMVAAAARALAEREGVRIVRLGTTDDAITLRLELDKLAALGFLAELRRQTNAWYEGKYRDGPLWGTPKPGESEEEEKDWSG